MLLRGNIGPNKRVLVSLENLINSGVQKRLNSKIETRMIIPSMMRFPGGFVASLTASGNIVCMRMEKGMPRAIRE